MKIYIQLEETSQPIEYDNVKNTYTKGDFYCIYLNNETVHKYPTINIWRVVEEYGVHAGYKEWSRVCTRCGVPHTLDYPCCSDHHDTGDELKEVIEDDM